MNYIEWTFDEKSPIYKQLAHRLEYGILSVRLLPEEDIPSIRSMADMLHLNVNTVARSYRLLNLAGLIYTHSNKNYTVTSDNDFVNQKRLQEVRLLSCEVSLHASSLRCRHKQSFMFSFRFAIMQRPLSSLP